MHPTVARELKPIADECLDADWKPLSDATVKEAVDKFFKLSNLLISKDGSLVKAVKKPDFEIEVKDFNGKTNVVPGKSSKAKSAAKPKMAKVSPPPRKTKDLPDLPAGTPVEHIADDVAIVKRYMALHGKKVKRDRVLSLLHGIQKAMLERRITKTDEHHTVVGKLEDQLRILVRYMDINRVDNVSVDIAKTSLDKYKAIAVSQLQMLTVKLLKKYIAMSGKTGMKERARKLYAEIEKAVTTGKISDSDKYFAQLDEAFQTLHQFINERAPKLKIDDYELNGLAGITGTSCSLAGTTARVRQRNLPSLYEYISGKKKVRLQATSQNRSYAKR